MNPKQERVQKERKGDITTEQNHNTSTDVEALSAPEETPSVISVTHHLEGKWRSVEDNSNLLIFENGKRKEITAGTTVWNIEDYQLSNKCLNELDTDNGLPLEESKYISCIKSDMCWYIINITDLKLELSYMGRGNTLIYEKFR